MSARRAAPAESGEQAIWQEVEFGSYHADLPLWVELFRGSERELVDSCGFYDVEDAV